MKTILRTSLLLAGAALSSAPAMARNMAENATHGGCSPVTGTKIVEAANGTHLAVRTIGKGKPIVHIPSLGRGVGDFDELATMLAKKGFLSILPEPRGINGSQGPQAATLFDLADDVATAVQAVCQAPVDVVGHAFGNRVARAFAAKHPGMVRKVALLAGGGEVPPTAEITRALLGSLSEGEKPDSERIEDLRLAFFAKGNDAAQWLTGWYKSAAQSQRIANQNTNVRDWWSAGNGSVLLVHPNEDPLAPRGNADKLKADIGDRLTLVILPHASHAILPEQPTAVAAVLSAYFDGKKNEAQLQSLANARAKVPQKN